MHALRSVAPTTDTAAKIDESLGGVAHATGEVRKVAAEKTRRIQAITGQVKILALNALIEATRAGE